jgi:hypothetical protein
VWDGSRKRRLEGSALIRRLIYVAFFVEVGLLLIVLPWSGFWDQNYFAEVFPLLKDLLTNNYIRGAVSGLGFVNLFAGFAELTFVFVARERRDHTFSDTGPRPR